MLTSVQKLQQHISARREVTISFLRPRKHGGPTNGPELVRPVRNPIAEGDAARTPQCSHRVTINLTYQTTSAILARKQCCTLPGSSSVFYVQRNHRNASTKEIAPHSARIAILLHCADRLCPCRIVARKASFSAVKGNILIKGCTTAGNLS